MQSYLQSGRSVDSSHPVVVGLAEKSRGNSAEPRDQAVALYYVVRNEVRYNPCVFSRDPQTLKASHALQQGESCCVSEAILLAACARHCRIPTRIDLANVRNHLATPRLLETLHSEVFTMHSYTELYLEGRWVKATPAFGRALCRAFDVAPLKFGDVADSILHPFNRQGERYMEYLVDHGQFADLSEELFFSHLQQHYPHLFSGRPLALSGGLQTEAGQDEGRRQSPSVGVSSFFGPSSVGCDMSSGHSNNPSAASTEEGTQNMLTTQGQKSSGDVRKTLWCAEEAGLEYQTVDAGGAFNLMDEPVSHAMNPDGRVPVIEDDGFVLWESNAIVRYLAAHYASGDLYPQDPMRRTDTDKWTDWTTSALTGPFRDLFWGTLRTPPEQRDEALVTKALQICGELLRVPDQALAGRPWLSDERFDMDDTPLGYFIYAWFEVPIERPPLPHLDAQYLRLRGRPAFHIAVMTELT